MMFDINMSNNRIGQKYADTKLKYTIYDFADIWLLPTVGKAAH